MNYRRADFQFLYRILYGNDPIAITLNEAYKIKQLVD